MFLTMADLTSEKMVTEHRIRPKYGHLRTSIRLRFLKPSSCNHGQQYMYSLEIADLSSDPLFGTWAGILYYNFGPNQS